MATKKTLKKDDDKTKKNKSKASSKKTNDSKLDKKASSGKKKSVKSSVKSSAPKIAKQDSEDLKREGRAPLKREQKTGYNFSRFFLGLLFILFGIFYLAQNMGWISINLGFDLWQLWPLLIVFLGLSMIKVDGWISAIISGVVTLATLSFIFILFLFNGTIASGNAENKSINIEKEWGAEVAEIRLKYGAGDVDIRGGADGLVEGNFKTHYLDLETNSKVEDTIQKIDIKTNDKWSSFFNKEVNELELELDSFTPTKLYLDTGPSKLDLDLRDVKLEVLDIDSEVSDINIDLGDKVDNLDVKISAGASSIELSLPDTVGAVIELDSGFTSKNLTGFDKDDDGVWKSINYESAEKIIEVDLDLGVSNLEINWR